MSPSAPLPGRASDRIGTVLGGRWRIGRILGSGGMSVVYQATHRNGMPVAIKVLHPELALRARTLRRFLREGYIANRVGHRGAVSVLDDGVDQDGTVYLVMELLEGETIGAQLRRSHGHHTPEQVLAIADGVLDVLAAAHAKGIVHRDVKPENVFITFAEGLKLLDFGIASIREISVTGADLTGSGLAMGTPAFMAPEQARGRWSEVDHRTDLWAVGAMMFTLLTNRHVHECQNGNEALILTATCPAPSLRDVAPELDPPIAEAVDRALAFAKEERWSDAGMMQRAVRTAGRERRLALPVPDPALEVLEAEPTYGSGGSGPADSAWSQVRTDTRAPNEPNRRGSRVWTTAVVGALAALLGGASLLELSARAGPKPPELASSLRLVTARSAEPRARLPRPAKPAPASKEVVSEAPAASPVGSPAVLGEPRRPAAAQRAVPGTAAATSSTLPAIPQERAAAASPIDPNRLFSNDVLDRRN